MDISAFLTPPDIMSAKRVLCIQPHPDDNEIGMGGVVAALAGRGCEVHYLTVTNGDLGDQSGTMEPAELAALRREETVAAGKALGASKFYFFDEPDGSLQDIPALAGKIATLVRTIRPVVLFCPDPWAMYEAHQDHVVTGRATAQAFISSALVRYPRGTATAPWQCAAIGFYFTQAPNTVVDITDTFEAKSGKGICPGRGAEGVGSAASALLCRGAPDLIPILLRLFAKNFGHPYAAWNAIA